MNITIDMVTGETENNTHNDVIVISNRYTSDKPEMLNNSDYFAPDLAQQQIEVESNTAVTNIPVEIINTDIDTFLNEMC